jgi:WD40 repeat protein/mono/diheme cytochrome c family protein
MTLARLPLLAGALLALAVSTSAPGGPADKKDQQPAGPVSYYKDVRRLFQQHCQGCHQPAKPQGGYIMTSHAEVLKPGDRALPNIVPGKPEQSALLGQIIPKNGKVAMPRGKGPLSPREIDLIKRWIAEGARDDTPRTAIDVVSDKNPPVYKLPPVIPSLDYSPDGTLLAVAGYHEVLLHKADGSARVGRLIGLAERIQSVAFSPDGKSLAVVGGSPGRFGEVQVWSVARKKLRFSVSVTFDTVYGVSWPPDGSKIAFGCADNTVRAIDSTDGKQVFFQGCHNDWVLGTTFSQDGEHLISVSRDMSMRLSAVKTQRFVDNITSITPGALKGGLQALARRPLAKRTTVKGVEGEKVYDEVVCGGSDGVPRLYQVHRTKQRQIGDDFNRLREYPKMTGRIYAVAFNKDGSQFAAGSSLDGSGEVRVYDAATGKLISTLDKIGGVFTVAFRPDGKEIASAGFDGKVRLSDPATGKLIKEFVPVPLAGASASAKK